MPRKRSWSWKVPWENFVLNQAIHTHVETPPEPPSKIRMFTDWDESLPQSHDSRRRSVTFQTPSSDSPFPPFTLGVLSSRSRQLQSCAFQIFTRHAFEADYSDKFWPLANDNTICPHCDDEQCFTIRHAIHECEGFRDIYPELIGRRDISELLSSETGARRLCKFIHHTQCLLRPLPPRNDPPDQ